MKVLQLLIGAGMMLFIAVSAPADTIYSFQTVIDTGDVSFTQLLGINNASTIAGYFGDGVVVLNNGFTLVLPNSFTPENFPGSVQTQVVGINNKGNTVGFYVDSASVTHGFTDTGGTFSTIDDPNGVLTQLLGLNDAGEAAGYWQNTGGTQFPFTELGGTFTEFGGLLPLNTGAQATDVNNIGEVSGFYLDASGDAHGFLLNGTTETAINYPGAVQTQVLGLNNVGQLSGFYIDASGNMHGFVDTSGSFQSIDDPFGLNMTTINGINDNGQVVGFYVDSAGNTDGFVATPVPEPGTLILFSSALAILAFKLRKRKA
jgi:hypothetical protein